MRATASHRVRLALCMAGFGAAGIAAAQETTNSEVYIAVTELADEVELIRETMGRPYDDSPRLPASGVTLFEVYFHLQTLALRSNRLARELAGAAPAAHSPAPARAVTAEDLMPLVELALADIRRVRAELGITEEVVRQQRDAPISPTGIFSVTLDTNRQLDLLLNDALSSADVFERLTTATGYAAGLLSRRGAGTVPAASPAEGPQRPADVYRRLLECMDLVSGIAAKAGVEVVTLSSRRNVPDDIEPGHVYDLAQFLVADLAWLAVELDAAPAAADAGRPRHVFPSHTFERAGELQAQLQRLDSTF